MTEEKSEQVLDEKKKSGGAAFFIPAGIFLGMAYGFYAGNLPLGIFAGLGLGFLLVGLSSIFFGQ